jgi:beta-glucosidase
VTDRSAPITRRRLLAALPAIAAAAAITSNRASADVKSRLTAAKPFPTGFLWGSSTSGHQVEGNNINSDSWLAEHVTPTIYKEPSGDSCDQYHRFREDIALMAQLGLNCYRFSLEWSRIEPEQGEFSESELDHYRRVLAACREFGVTPFVMFNHVTVPRWFAARGGWENSESPDLFVRYCERANTRLGDFIGIAGTFNEPCVGGMLKWLGIPQSFDDGLKAMCRAAAASMGSDRFSMLFSYDQEKLVPQLLEAHRKAAIALKSGPHRYPVGLTLNVADDHAVGPDSLVAKKRAELYAPWLEAAKSQDDFIGIQNYGRLRYDNKGRVRPDARNPDGDSFYPEGLEAAIRYAAKATGKPIYISENGFATEDDSRRVEFIERAVAGVKRAVDDGIDVRSYVHWSFLDNFEWFDGYKKDGIGLVAVDRKTFKRRIKPSALYLGSIARRNSLG